MSFSTYLWGIRLLTLLASIAWIGIVFSVDPDRSTTLGRGLFFISLFAAVLGILTLFVTWLYRKALGDVTAAHYAASAFRQAFLLAVFAIAIAIFQYFRWLTWWDAALLFAAVLLAEFTARRVSRV